VASTSTLMFVKSIAQRGCKHLQNNSEHWQVNAVPLSPSLRHKLCHVERPEARLRRVDALFNGHIYIYILLDYIDFNIIMLLSIDLPCHHTIQYSVQHYLRYVMLWKMFAASCKVLLASWPKTLRTERLDQLLICQIAGCASHHWGQVQTGVRKSLGVEGFCFQGTPLFRPKP
jgi:hypothetical protein